MKICGFTFLYNSLSFICLAAKYDVIESVRSDRWVWATHLFSELLDVEKLLKTNAKVFFPRGNLI